MNSFYPHLFSPLTIRGVTFKNRLLSAPHAICWISSDNRPNDDFIAFFEAKARGGFAQVSIAGGDIDADKMKLDTVALHMNRHILPRLSEVARAIHQHGAVASLQLAHGGAYFPPGPNGENPVSASAFTRWDGQKIDEITVEQMREIAEAFGRYASLAQEAGFDMVQVHGGHGWLFSQFLAEDINHRTDEFGGSMENRARFPIMVIDEIRKAVGERFLIEYRISGDEFWPGGYTLDDAVDFCRLIDGKVDLIHVSAARDCEDEGCCITHPTIYRENGCNVYLAEAIKKAVRTPVAAVGAINTPELAESIIAEGRADFVAMARATIADPDFAVKARLGRSEDIRACTRCLNCLTGMQTHGTFTCSVNPSAGREIRTGLLPPARRQIRLAVIGGGVGGMQAAVTASERGHQVTLFEQSDHLGGIVSFMDHDFLKQDLRRFKDYLITQVRKRPIDVRLNTKADLDILRELAPDSIIVATGSVPARPDIPGLKEYASHVLEVELGSLRGKVVAVIGGGLAGCETAAELAREGCKTHIIHKYPEFARDGNWMQPVAFREAAAEYGIEIHIGRCAEILPEGAVVETEEGAREIVRADTVLYALGMTPRKELADILRCEFDDVIAVGDCVRPRKVQDAVHEAYYAALDLGWY